MSDTLEWNHRNCGLPDVGTRDHTQAPLEECYVLFAAEPSFQLMYTMFDLVLPASAMSVTESVFSPGTDAPVNPLSVEGLPTLSSTRCSEAIQRGFSRCSHPSQGRWPTVRTRELYPSSLALRFPIMTSLGSAQSHGALITGCLSAAARALRRPWAAAGL